MGQFMYFVSMYYVDLFDENTVLRKKITIVFEKSLVPFHFVSMFAMYLMKDKINQR